MPDHDDYDDDGGDYHEEVENENDNDNDKEDDEDERRRMNIMLLKLMMPSTSSSLDDRNSSCATFSFRQAIWEGENSQNRPKFAFSMQKRTLA